MPKFKIENVVEVIEYEIDGKTYTVPLATGLKRDELEKLTTQDALAAFFKKHIGADIWDDLTTGAQNQIAKAWTDESEKASGVKVGE